MTQPEEAAVRVGISGRLGELIRFGLTGLVGVAVGFGFYEAVHRFPADVEGNGYADWGLARSYRNQIEIWDELGFLRSERASSKPGTMTTTIRLRMQTDESAEQAVEPANRAALMLDAFARAMREGRHEALMTEGRRQAMVIGAVQNEMVAG